MIKRILFLALLFPLVSLSMQVPQSPIMVPSANIDFDDASEINDDADSDVLDDYSAQTSVIG